MPVDYNKYAKTFAQSRKDMSWPELEYCFGIMKKGASILDLACGSGRLLWEYNKFFWASPATYLWIDISQGLINEAKEAYPEQNFLLWDMRSFWQSLWSELYENIFCIAGFHHLESYEQRLQTLKEMKNKLSSWARVYMTNWSLHTWENREKYKKSQIWESENKYGSFDYKIKIGEHFRYYHSFSLEELWELAHEIWFNVLENRIFDTGRNSLTILEK